MLEDDHIGPDGGCIECPSTMHPKVPRLACMMEHLGEAVRVRNEVAEATVHTVQIANSEMFMSSGSQKLCAVISTWRVVSHRLCYGCCTTVEMRVCYVAEFIGHFLRSKA